MKGAARKQGDQETLPRDNLFSKAFFSLSFIAADYKRDYPGRSTFCNMVSLDTV